MGNGGPTAPFPMRLDANLPPPPRAGEAALLQICICKLIGGFGTCLATTTLVTIPLLSIWLQKNEDLEWLKKREKNGGAQLKRGNYTMRPAQKLIARYYAILRNIMRVFLAHNVKPKHRSCKKKSSGDPEVKKILQHFRALDRKIMPLCSVVFYFG